MNDLLDDVLACLKAREFEQAQERIQSALDTSSVTEHTSRQSAVGEVSKALVRLKLQRQRFFNALNSLEPIDRLAAENRLAPLAEELFGRERVRLRKQKRLLSRPT